MARVSKQQMEHNREAIIQVSSTLFREHGLNGVSLNDLMAAAGLTHGGFYGHFASKDELAAIAGRKAIENLQCPLAAPQSGNGPAGAGRAGGLLPLNNPPR